MKLLIKEMAIHHDDFVMDAFRHEIDQCSKIAGALNEECEHILSELVTIELTDGQKNQIMAVAAKIIDGLDDATFENKREVMEFLDV